MESSTVAEIKPHLNCVAVDNNYFLSAEQKQFYVENGYLVIKRMFDFDELYNFKEIYIPMCDFNDADKRLKLNQKNCSIIIIHVHRQHFILIAKGLVDKGNSTVVREPSLVKKGMTGEQAINKVQEIHYDDVFMTYTEHPKLLNVLSQFIGDNIRVMNSMFINKPPGSSHHPPHQDLFYFPFRPAEKIIASWTAVDEVTKDNGCLFIIPRSHKLNHLYAHGHLPDANKLYHGILDKSVFDSSKYVQLEMTPGDTVFFHPLLVHGSGPNITKFYRKSITAHYASGYCQYVDVGGTVQEVVAKDIENEAQRRGFDLSFVDTWRFKSKQVMGARANL